MSESFDYSYGSTLGYDSWFLLSFTRGSVQIKDNNAYGGRVDIDPRYFGTEFDSLAQAATARYTRLVSQAQPLSGFVTGESAPGGSVPNGANLDAWVTWVKANFRSNWHPAGTVCFFGYSWGQRLIARLLGFDDVSRSWRCCRFAVQGRESLAPTEAGYRANYAT